MIKKTKIKKTNTESFVVTIEREVSSSAVELVRMVCRDRGRITALKLLRVAVPGLTPMQSLNLLRAIDGEEYENAQN